MGYLSLSVKTRNAMLQALADAGPATLEIYGGGQPANSGEPLLPDNVLFGELKFSKPPAPPPTNGVLTFSLITAAPASLASGIAVWGRVKDTTGQVILDGDVRDDGTGMINFNRKDFVQGGPITLTSFILQIPERIYF